MTFKQNLVFYLKRMIMKRIYMTLGLIGALSTGAFAQSVDLEAVVALPMDGATISPGQSLDTADVLCGIIYNGPDTLFGGDYIWYMNSFSTPATDSTTYIDAIAYPAGTNFTQADSGVALFIFPNEQQFGAGHSAPYTLVSDSIRGLYDWEQWNNNDSIVLIRPPYEVNKEYGFYFRALFVGDDNANEIGTDPNPSNNRAVTRIIWGDGVGIKDLIAPKDKVAINVYPNPARNTVNFEFKHSGNSHAYAIVRDLSGRIVSSKNYGRVLAGNQKYSLDVSKLAAGNYILEFNTDTQVAVSKITIQK